MSNSSQTTLIPPSEQDDSTRTSISEQDRQAVKVYWESSGFGLSRLDKASKFELERAEEAERAERTALESMAKLKQAQHQEKLRRPLNSFSLA
jgi:hypothetical protein